MVSLYTEWLNHIKQTANSTWLTGNQRLAYESILTKWLNEPFLCLYGPSGCGKTFIGRLLAKEHGYVYTHDLYDVKEPASHIVLDCQEYNRLMRPLLQAKGWTRIILLLSRPPRDPMPAVSLELNDRDVKQFQSVLARNSVISVFLSNVDTTDLNYVIRSEAIIRGNKEYATE